MKTTYRGFMERALRTLRSRLLCAYRRCRGLVYSLAGRDGSRAPFTDHRYLWVLLLATIVADGVGCTSTPHATKRGFAYRPAPAVHQIASQWSEHSNSNAKHRVKKFKHDEKGYLFASLCLSALSAVHRPSSIVHRPLSPFHAMQCNARMHGCLRNSDGRRKGRKKGRTNETNARAQAYDARFARLLALLACYALSTDQSIDRPINQGKRKKRNQNRMWFLCLRMVWMDLFICETGRGAHALHRGQVNHCSSMHEGPVSQSDPFPSCFQHMLSYPPFPPPF